MARDEHEPWKKDKEGSPAKFLSLLKKIRILLFNMNEKDNEKEHIKKVYNS